MTEQLADWEVELLLPDINEGDLVRAEKGYEILQARAEHVPSIGATLLDRSVRFLARDGYTVTVVEKAKPKLPTEPGIYDWNGVDTWRLSPGGQWQLLQCGADEERRTSDDIVNVHPFPEGEDAASFTRLVPEVTS